jgi:hypothetical protein
MVTTVQIHCVCGMYGYHCADTLRVRYVWLPLCRYTLFAVCMVTTVQIHCVCGTYGYHCADTLCVRYVWLPLCRRTAVFNVASASPRRVPASLDAGQASVCFISNSLKLQLSCQTENTSLVICRGRCRWRDTMCVVVSLSRDVRPMLQVPCSSGGDPTDLLDMEPPTVDTFRMAGTSTIPNLVMKK